MDATLATTTTPMSLLATALEKGVDADTLRQFMDLNDRHEQAQAKKHYAAQLAEAILGRGRIDDDVDVAKLPGW